MLADHLADAIGNAPLRLLDDLARDVWRGLGTGMLSEATASTLSEAVEARRVEGRALAKAELKRPSLGSLRGWSYFPPKRPQRSPDRARSIARRRQLASASPLPPSIAPRFTVGELAALAVIGSQVADHGACDRSVPELAARAGVSASTVRNAVREARRLGLLTVEEQRRHRAPNLPNVVRIVSAEWLAWIARSPKGGVGCKKPKATVNLSSIGRKERESAGMAPLRWPLAARFRNREVGEGRAGMAATGLASGEVKGYRRI